MAKYKRIRAKEGRAEGGQTSRSIEQVGVVPDKHLCKVFSIGEDEKEM